MLIPDIVFQLLSYVVQTERGSIHLRQAESISEAKARGVRFGRSRLEIPGGFEELACECRSGGVLSRQAAEKLGISHTTFLRRVKEVHNC